MKISDIVKNFKKRSKTMGNLEEKLRGGQIKSPHNIPMSVYIQEADIL